MPVVQSKDVYIHHFIELNILEYFPAHTLLENLVHFLISPLRGFSKIHMNTSLLFLVKDLATLTCSFNPTLNN